MIKLKLMILSVMICCTAIIHAQISGVVTSGSDGSPLPGVSIVVKSTSTGTVTDIDGKYTIDAPEGSTLVFSYVGFTTKEVSIGNQKVIDIISVSYTHLDVYKRQNQRRGDFRICNQNCKWRSYYSCRKVKMCIRDRGLKEYIT